MKMYVSSRSLSLVLPLYPPTCDRGTNSDIFYTSCTFIATSCVWNSFPIDNLLEIPPYNPLLLLSSPILITVTPSAPTLAGDPLLYLSNLEPSQSPSEANTKTLIDVNPLDQPLGHEPRPLEPMGSSS